jgi:peptidoglycan hydrolase CwlO-like protein
VFDQVKSLLSNFRGDIQKEQIDAAARCSRENKWVVNQINLAIAKLAHRTKDVNDLKAHIKWLQNEIKETRNAIKSRQDRIAANLRLLEQFKKERCENNLLFVKSLREHIEGIEVMSLLRADIVDYFRSKSRKSVSFLEKFAEFEHLLDEENKLVLSQLKTKLAKLPNHRALHAKTDAYTKTSGRSARQIGSGHVDNRRGELRRLATPGYEQLGLFLTKLEKKVLFMIDSLILHLRNSRDQLTRNEIKAAEDFAIFQKNMYRENGFLADKIKQLQARLVDLTVQLNKANQQLVRREKLRREAEIQLANFRRMKREKDDYCRREQVRRVGELANVSNAESIFQNVLNKLSLRVKLRTQSNTEGKGYKKGEEYEKRVRRAAPGAQAGYSTRVRSRNQVAY